MALSSSTRIFARLGAVHRALNSFPSLSQYGLSSSVTAVRSLSTLASRYPSWINTGSNIRSTRQVPHGGSTTSAANSRVLWYASSAVVVTVPLTTTVGLAELSTVSSSSSSFFDDSKHEGQRSLSTSTPTASTAANLNDNLDIVLYQFQVCPFCNKVRAYLDYHKIPYRVVEVDPLRKTELRDFSKEYRKVPIALINSQQVNGSSNVISTVESLKSGKGKDEFSFSPVEDRWMKWLDDHFIHLISPNIYRTPAESLQTFNYITDKSKFTWWQRASIRYTGAAAMYFIGRRLKKKYDINDERQEIHAAINDWMKAINEGGTDFLDGQKTPGVVDLSMYGVLKAIETFDTFVELRKQNGDFASWYDRVKEIVGTSTQTVEN